MKTSKLRVKYEYDFEVFAIISTLKGYKLTWELNNLFGIHLRKAEDLYYEFIKEGKILITNYLYQTEYTCIRLLKNKSCEYYDTSKPYLLPEMKKYDYLFRVSGEVPFMDADAIIQSIKCIKAVDYIKKVNIESLKSKENLIF